MAQISRPFQIVLVVFGLFVAVWAVALRGHSTNTSATGSPPAASTPAPSSSAQPAKAGAPNSIYHGPAPGVEGLSRAIARAHGAVSASEQSTKRLQQNGGQTPSTTGPTPSAAGSSSASSASAEAPAATTHRTAAPSLARTPVPSTSKTSLTPSVHTGQKAPTSPATSASPLLAHQRAVEHQLAQGKIVVVLLWNPKGTDDVLVHDELDLMIGLHLSASKARSEELRHEDKFLGSGLDRKIAVDEASSKEVASFGSITRGIQVYTTPTLLIINGHRQVKTLTGATDAYSIEQAIEEAHNG